ncbi:hypothetical protein MPL3356_340166 [Mesorhizobium plurifarium]|uniref:Uncharacterized protein n=1 Tax=Mesorhizobium plurifarium TaxID=69974 RepID=A0A090E2N9_MESPL|nr:hypothetical protein MPL3356_340166 [Mesorhizobium plurifarium]
MGHQSSCQLGQRSSKKSRYEHFPIFGLRRADRLDLARRVWLTTDLTLWDLKLPYVDVAAEAGPQRAF